MPQFAGLYKEARPAAKTEALPTSAFLSVDETIYRQTNRRLWGRHPMGRKRVPETGQPVDFGVDGIFGEPVDVPHWFSDHNGADASLSRCRCDGKGGDA